MRRYREPRTVRSSTFDAFLSSKRVVLDAISEVLPEDLLMEFRPPRISDFVEHMSRFGSSRPVDSEMIYAHREYILDLIPGIEGVERKAVRFNDWLSMNNAMCVRVSRDTSPGIRWTVLGFRTKEDALPHALNEVEQVIQRLREGTRTHFPPCVPAGRGKIVDMASGSDTKQGRLILMPDLVRHIMGSLASVPYSKFVKECSKDKGGVMIGMGPFNSWYDTLVKHVESEPVDFFMTVDFKGFDQTVPEEILDLAMDSISERFSSCAGDFEYWIQEKENLIRTEIAMPDGEVYQKARGVSSGDPWTSQAGSKAHLIMVLIWFKVKGIKGRIWAFGDDGLLAISGGLAQGEAVKEMKEFFVSKFGMEVKMADSYASDTLVMNGPYPVEGASIKFLSNYFMRHAGRVVPVPPTRSCLRGLLYPERNPEVKDPNFHAKDNYDFEIQRATAYYVLYYFNSQAREMIMLYIEFLRGLRTPSDVTLDLPLLTRELKSLDIPYHNFCVEWVRRLPNDTEITELYLYGKITRYSEMHEAVNPPSRSAYVGMVVKLLVDLNLRYTVKSSVSDHRGSSQ